ncbi:MAG TPA: galactose oxidase-like domain-containing protein [Thermoanaerobaculia bacterium]
MRLRSLAVFLLLALVSLPLTAQPSAVGEWGAKFAWPVVAIHAHVLPDGEVLTWERKDTVLTTESWLWNPKTGHFSKVENPYASVFCSGHSFLPDGTLLVTGGHHYRDGDGEKTATLFHTVTKQWTKGPNMNGGRWYPTNLTLRNGDVVTMSGSQNGSDAIIPNPLPQVWQTATSTWRDLTGAIRTLDLYPQVLLAPDGRAFVVGPQPQTLYLETAGTGSWKDGLQTSGVYRDYGSAVEYEPGKVLIVGGGPPVNTAEIIDLNAGSPKWTMTEPMKFSRRQLNATILPDGKVLVTGGSSAPGFNNAEGSVFAAEMWDPATGKWTTMASMKVRRLYHSTAVLLPDGRVLSAGGGMPASPEGGDTDHRDAEIYSPPYLFNGPRPAITAAPDRVGFGEEFRVETPEGANIEQVTWIRLSSVTHAFYQSQRFNRLHIVSKDAGHVVVTAPSNAECPPGPYLLFVLNGRGVPSVGKVVFIR